MELVLHTPFFFMVCCLNKQRAIFTFLFNFGYINSDLLSSTQGGTQLGTCKADIVLSSPKKYCVQQQIQNNFYRILNFCSIKMPKSKFIFTPNYCQFIMVMMLTPSPFPTFQHVSVCLADVRYLCRYITPPTFCLINLTDRSVIQTAIFTTIQHKTVKISDCGPTVDVPLILNIGMRWKECNSWACDSGNSIPGTSVSGSRWIRNGWNSEMV